MNQLRAWVANWQRQRRVAVGDSSIVFQVTLTCGHCSICSRRVQEVSEALARSGANWRWVEPPMGWPYGVRCVSIDRINGQEPLAQLRDNLNLYIETPGEPAFA